MFFLNRFFLIMITIVHVGCSALFADLFDHKTINLSEFHLYKILVGIQATHIAEKIEQIEHPELLESPAYSQSNLAFIETALHDLRSIIDYLNDSGFEAHLEIGYKLINAYNFLQDKEISPRNIRRFKAEIKKFDEELKDFYQKRKYFLSGRVVDLTNKVLKLNALLANVILKEENFEFSYTCLFKDLVLHRPFEFACKHKILTVGTIALTSAFLITKYGYPRYIQYVLANRNTKYPELRQIHGFSQHGGADCGYYALTQALVMQAAVQNNSDVAANVMQSNFNKISSLSGVIEGFRSFILYLRGENAPTDWLDDDEIRTLANQGTINRLSSAFDTVGIRAAHLALNNVHVVANPAQLFENGIGLEESLREGILRFRNHNTPQAVVLGLGSDYVGKALERLKARGSTKEAMQKASNEINATHWISVLIQRDNQGVLKPIIVDSQNSNKTALQDVTNLIQLFTETPIPSEFGLVNVSNRIDNAQNLLEQGLDLYRYLSAANHLARGIRAILDQGDPDAQQRELDFYHADFERILQQIHQGLQILGDGDLDFIDLDNGIVIHRESIASVDAFIEALRQE